MISSNFTLRFFIDDVASLSHSSVYPQIHGFFSKLAYLLILILTLNALNDKQVRQRYPFFICKVLYNVNYHICCLVGRIGLSLPALPSGWLSYTVFKLLFCGFSQNDGQIATEVPLAPNLLILCGRQSRCWLYLAKTSAQDRLFTGFCGASGQSNLWQLYLPSRPDAPSSK